MEVLFAGLKNNNYQGKKKKRKHKKTTKTRTASSAAQGRQGPRLGSGCTARPSRAPARREITKTVPFCPFFQPEGVFLPSREAPGGAAQPHPLRTPICFSPSLPENRLYSSDLFHKTPAAASAGIFLGANKTVRWAGGEGADIFIC